MNIKSGICTKKCLFLLLIILLSMPAAIKHIDLLFNPLPLEIRDGAALDTAIAMRDGINVYSPDTFPQYIYLYGGLFPWLISLILKFVKPSFKILSAIILFFTVGIIFEFSFLCKRKIADKDQRFIAIWSFIGIFLPYSLMRFYWNGLRPCAPGMFFMLAAIIIADIKNYTWGSLGISLLCSLIAFHFKQYFIFCLPLICLNLFLYRSKLKGILYGIVGVLAFGFSLWLICLKYPLYINYTLFHHLTLKSYKFSHMMKQLFFFLPVITPFIMILVQDTYHKINKKSQWKNLVDFKHPNIALLKSWNGNIWRLGFICALFYFIVSMGGHNGATYIYFIDLVLPFLLIDVVFVLTNNSMHSNSFQFICRSSAIFSAITMIVGMRWSISSENTIDGGILLVSLLVLLLFMEKRINFHKETFLALVLCGITVFSLRGYFSTIDFRHTENIENFGHLSRVVKNCNSLVLPAYAYPYRFGSYGGNVALYDNGQTEYAWSVLLRDNNSFLSRFFSETNQKLVQRLEEFNRYQTNLQNKEYDCVLVDSISFYKKYLDGYEESETFKYKGIKLFRPIADFTEEQTK